MVALVADRLRLEVVDEVGLEAENRLDPVLLAGLVELDGAVHDPVVGEPESGLAELRGALRQGVDLARAVEQRVLAVDVQMCAGGRAHRRIQIRFGSGRGRGAREPFPLFPDGLVDRRMGLYGDHVLPRMINCLCGLKMNDPLRERTCQGLEGDVVEIGFGSGLNIPFYPASVNRGRGGRAGRHRLEAREQAP